MVVQVLGGTDALTERKWNKINLDFDESGLSKPTYLVVAERLRVSGMTTEQIAVKANLHHETVLRFMNLHTQSPRAETLCSLASVVEVDLSPRDAVTGDVLVPTRLIKKVIESRAERKGEVISFRSRKRYRAGPNTRRRRAG